MITDGYVDPNYQYCQFNRMKGMHYYAAIRRMFAKSPAVENEMIRIDGKTDKDDQKSFH